MLENFRSDDEMMVFGTVQELATTLSMATDNTLNGFPTDSFITELLKVIQNPGSHALANEVSCKCITSSLSDRLGVLMFNQSYGYLSQCSKLSSELKWSQDSSRCNGKKLWRYRAF